MAVPGETQGLAEGEIVSDGFARTHNCGPKLTLTVAPIEETERTENVIPALVSLKVCPTIKAGSNWRLMLPGDMSKR